MVAIYITKHYDDIFGIKKEYWAITSILDVGCDRDMFLFEENGFLVDGSVNHIDYAKKRIKGSVSCCSFEEFESTTVYNAIWLRFSLIFIPHEEALSIIKKLTNNLRKKWIGYAFLLP